jgi:hypothetical protein
MTELEQKVRAALRRQADKIDQSPPRGRSRSGPRTAAALVVATAFAAASVGALVWVQRDSTPQAAPTSSGSASMEPTPTPEVCAPPPYSVSRLPWLSPGAQVPAPEVSQDGMSSVSVWFEDADARWSGTYIALISSPRSPVGDDLDTFPRVEVRGVQASLVWVGDPGVGELALVWTEGTGACTWRVLSLGTQGFSERQAEQALGQVANSLA